MSIFVTHTPLSQMRPIGSEGERSFARVTALIERHLTPRHAAILADPVPVRDGSGIDWYIDADGEIAALSELPESEAQAVRAELADMLSDFRRAADTLDAGGTGKQHAAAVALRNAALFPGEDFVFVARDDDQARPIIVGWSYESHDPSAAHAFSVSAFGPDRVVAQPAAVRPAVPAETPPAAQPDTSTVEETVRTVSPAEVGIRSADRGGKWRLAALVPLLPAILSLLLLVAITALLLPACGLRTPFGTINFGFPATYGCASIASAVVAPALTESNDLGRELSVVQQEYQRQRLACLVPQQPAQVERQAAAPQAEEQEFNERVDQRGEAQITLIWEGQDDLDLWVICPSGVSINYQNPRACGGNLDIDQNTEQRISPNPVENVTFPQGLTETGAHRIGVKLYTSRTNQSPVPFRVRVRDARGTRMLQGQLARQGDSVIIDQMVK
ncbi:hypothetical protein ELI03_35355 [Rhizobium leguminosarum]|uniref:Uncharacterized protein n=1 Tax=Rhizobium leguminosarum TaxID=384 RepID=A0A4Q8XP23_RHILE|nr:hypothetical protein [Rhizobium leguminosarum]TAX64128.1 hypothetical protein ELI03_35355 [Rhizobium leguminosarum]